MFCVGASDMVTLALAGKIPAASAAVGNRSEFRKQRSIDGPPT
jgi:hypothetical protein